MTEFASDCPKEENGKLEERQENTTLEIVKEQGYTDAHWLHKYKLTIA